MPVLALSKVERNYRIVIPSEVVKLLELGEGDEVEWIFEEGKILVRKAVSVVECPYCGYRGGVSTFKLLKEQWRYGYYQVRLLECPKCHGVFMYYYGVTPRGKWAEFTIKVKPRQRASRPRKTAREKRK